MTFEYHPLIWYLLPLGVLCEQNDTSRLIIFDHMGDILYISYHRHISHYGAKILASGWLSYFIVSFVADVCFIAAYNGLMSNSQLVVSFESQSWLKVKVVKWCRKKWNEYMMYKYIKYQNYANAIAFFSNWILGIPCENWRPEAELSENVILTAFR